MNPSQEAQLIEQCRTDAAAFGQVFDAWYKPVFGYIMRRTGDYDLSKDIAAETFSEGFFKNRQVFNGAASGCRHGCTA
jgi:DNA-directed RNA polymerase specialized sigma24 family protein